VNKIANSVFPTPVGPSKSIEAIGPVRKSQAAERALKKCHYLANRSILSEDLATQNIPERAKPRD
jgi:hypothetical protein